MVPKRFLEDREHALENEYFHRKDHELIERLREEGRKQAERHDLEHRLGTHDTAFLEQLQAAGFAPDNLSLLHTGSACRSGLVGGRGDREGT